MNNKYFQKTNHENPMKNHAIQPQKFSKNLFEIGNQGRQKEKIFIGNTSGKIPNENIKIHKQIKIFAENSRKIL